MTPDWAALNERLKEDADLTLDPATARTVGGGSINASWHVTSNRGPVFLKTNAASGLSMFEAEAEGLAELERADAVRVPHVHATGVCGNAAYVVLEWIDMGGRGGGALLGERLARQHRVTAEQFGWHRDNTIGSTPQPNPQCDDWLEFYGEHRLRFQYYLASNRGYGSRAAERGYRLIEHLASFFPAGLPEPSLLHGDLWGGNWGVAADGTPVIFDPAVYYGDREADLAMTRLFGGFGGDFYAAYSNAWPLPEGHEIRVELYNLYHVLNHYNLFGGGYGSQAAAMTDRLLAHV